MSKIETKRSSLGNKGRCVEGNARATHRQVVNDLQKQDNNNAPVPSIMGIIIEILVYNRMTQLGNNRD